MNPEAIIKALLEADSAVTALAGTRLYAGNRPEGDPLPGAVWSVISDAPRTPVCNLAGPEPCDARIELQCFGRSYEEARQLANAATDACHRQSGVIAGITVTVVLAQGGPTHYDALVNAHGQVVDFIVHYLR